MEAKQARERAVGQKCCQKCGQAYSNARPSAKQRRAHKKHCALSLGESKTDGEGEEKSMMHVKNGEVVAVVDKLTPDVGSTEDPYNQVDNEEHWVSFSDGSTASTRASSDASTENVATNVDFSEEPSLMIPVQSCRQLDSSKIQLIQDKEELNSSPLRKDNEIIREVANRDMTAEIENERSGKPNVSVKGLLEPELEITEHAENAEDDSVSLASKKVESLQDGYPRKSQTCNTVSVNSNETQGKTDTEDQDLPARLPARKDEKRQVKKKSFWVRFICCC